MEVRDDELLRFDEIGSAPLPIPQEQGFVEHDGARIWYAVCGSGDPVVLLHSGLGNSGNWGYQVAALLSSGYRAVLIDSRGHGRSTRDARALIYERMAFDVIAVMDHLRIAKAPVVGWSDGAIIALILAMQASARVVGVFCFGSNMDSSGVKSPGEPNLLLDRCLSRHALDYASLSSTPKQFRAFAQAVTHMMKTQPNYAAHDLHRISVPAQIVHAEHDEFITREHADYLAENIATSSLVLLRDVSHFAPLQRPEQFNRAMLDFLHGTAARGRPTAGH